MSYTLPALFLCRSSKLPTCRSRMVHSHTAAKWWSQVLNMATSDSKAMPSTTRFPLGRGKGVLSCGVYEARAQLGRARLQLPSFPARSGQGTCLPVPGQREIYHGWPRPHLQPYPGRDLGGVARGDPLPSSKAGPHCNPRAAISLLGVPIRLLQVSPPLLEKSRSVPSPSKSLSGLALVHESRRREGGREGERWGGSRGCCVPLVLKTMGSRAEETQP